MVVTGMGARAGTVVRGAPRTDADLVKALGEHGVATVHEAQGRSGLLAPAINPVWAGARVAGTAVTVSVPPGDNWMIHVAVELCAEGDVLVVAPTSRSETGYLGDLLATALQTRGVRAAVVDAGVRDVAELTAMRFPVWSRCISATGAVKETLGTVNVPLVCAGQLINPGDTVVADDDGVVVVPREDAVTVLEAARRREASEARSRERYLAGELSLDVHGMRAKLEAAGLTYLDHPGGTP